MKTMRAMAFTLVLVGLAATAGVAQTGSADQDPAVRKAREETAVVFDLGRILGFIRTMESEKPTLRLEAAQVRDLYAIMTAIRQSERIEPRRADEWLVTIEEEILTAAQLAYIDKLYLDRASTAQSGAGTGSGSAGAAGGEASGSIATYIAGGAFNPIMDTTKSMGQDFARYYDELAARR